MLNWLFGKNLDEHLKQTKKIKISGVRFEIRKINALNYLDGSKALKSSYDLYKNKSIDDSQLVNDKKIREHFSHVIYAGVVSPKLSLSEKEDGILIEKMFVDWDMVTSLYNEIMFFTYGKKKMKLQGSVAKN